MTNLYTRDGSRPAPLPARHIDSDGKTWTDLAGQLAEGTLANAVLAAWPTA